MSTPLSELRSREVFDPKSGTTYRVRFGGIRVMQLTAGREIFLVSKLNLKEYGTIMFSGVNERTGQAWRRDGFALKVVEVDGAPVDKDWNLVSRRGQQRLLPFLESGEYLEGVFEVTPVGEDVDTTYQIRRIPPE